VEGIDLALLGALKMRSRLWVYAIHCVALGRSRELSASAVAVFAVSYGLNRFHCWSRR